MTTETNSPRPLPDAHTAFGLAVRLAEQITSLDMGSATKERVAATQLLRAAIEGRDRMHNERNAALVAALEAVLQVACENGAEESRYPSDRAAIDQARAALAAARNT